MTNNVSGWKRLFIAVLVIVFAGFVQNTALLNIGGVKPNFILAVLIVFSFFIHDILEYLFLVVLAAIFLRFSSGIELTTAVVVVLAIAAHVFHDVFPGRPFFNNAVIILLATLVFYAVSDAKFLYNYSGTVALEAFYSAVWGSLVFIASRAIFQHEGARIKF